MNNELIPQPSWWKRNWKWVLPVSGCLTLIIGAIVIFTSIYFGVTNMMEGSQPYEYAHELINQDEELLKILGSPIEKDGVVQGNINWINGNKSAKMTIPIAGPNGSGTLYIDASGRNDEWIYHEIRVEVNEKEYDFLEDSNNQD
ncbi:cytochrome c oxidase assembly factor Coa1 family protein [Croceitalea rosinachiae]|uniref:Cytochrome c oxidase assembly factor Coa1 family protein n=1 Tax=Croceitalea rosinachiae TaxID=3075596 RepID=A0ABU3ACC9_9FLAO|nr:cytochrome c oxidase assembly factor Coa1 family protein [Croceitalea sp. F388]MDT0606571.1 cytochrome c oxidase assembly factor Coa1 family protein [Croceitalea sp. F388]